MLDIDAVAFDLDGTLYPNYRFYIRLFPFAVRHHRLLCAFGKARAILRSTRVGDPLYEQEFYEAQAFLMAHIMDRHADKPEVAAMRESIERLIYRGWEPLFKNVRLFPHVPEVLAALKRKGLKLGLLSDFPLKQKLIALGLSGMWDAALCSEEIGRLKPDPKPFMALAETLGTCPARILYAGNSRRYDVAGAAHAGMKTALKVPFPLHYGHTPVDDKNFVFCDYRYLCDYVIT
ncbi:MAG: HAD family hydrolase [Treponema sp.]|jgi:putative hydrolase of the HAD superfamily|nr:HAD family hydrolase [Treponema sp.]